MNWLTVDWKLFKLSVLKVSCRDITCISIRLFLCILSICGEKKDFIFGWGGEVGVSIKRKCHKGKWTKTWLTNLDVHYACDLNVTDASSVGTKKQAELCEATRRLTILNFKHLKLNAIFLSCFSTCFSTGGASQVPTVWSLSGGRSLIDFILLRRLLLQRLNGIGVEF